MRRSYRNRYQRSGVKRWVVIAGIVALVLALGLAAYKMFAPTSVERAASGLQFDDTVTAAEKQTIQQAVKDQSKTYDGDVNASVKTSVEATNGQAVLAAYVPVTHLYATRQAVTKAELSGINTFVPSTMDEKTREAVAVALGVSSDTLKSLTTPAKELPETAVAFLPASEIAPDVKLLAFEGSYYLDSFTKGGVFREAAFGGEGASGLTGLSLNTNASKDATLKVNMTGVTALTRMMMKKLPSVGSATYFSEKIGDFLADADITHVSNEVSFQEGCQYSNTSFCSPPEMINALKDSGVDLVELTGNHNNDRGNQYNTETINLYHSLGWNTFGGGLNTAAAGKPYIANQKGSTVTFLGYNYADGPNSGALSTTTTAGANGFSFEKVKADVAEAKKQSSFVVVDIQFWECYAYPDGYVEYPQCDTPIPTQKEVFRQVADSGADMVVGSSAHQPQTYELYNGKPIYYGLGNLYFEQTSWPGTERGIILTHYFARGKLVQTKLSPTVYHTELQTRLMNADEAAYLLNRLKTARQTAGL